MRAIIPVLLLAGCLAGCGARPLTAGEISIIDDRCPNEMYLAGICDQPPLAPKPIAD